MGSRHIITSIVRCRACKYDLRDLTENRCPECGRAFDPKDATSFALDNPTSVIWRTVSDVLLYLLVLSPFIIVVLATLLSLYSCKQR
jgi:hypothetical protein